MVFPVFSHVTGVVGVVTVFVIHMTQQIAVDWGTLVSAIIVSKKP